MNNNNYNIDITSLINLADCTSAWAEIILDSANLLSLAAAFRQSLTS